jgi:hypothetical protein
MSPPYKAYELGVSAMRSGRHLVVHLGRKVSAPYFIKIGQATARL